jgi:hypothetical protein
MHLHTYHPIEVDEGVLTDHECREVLIEFFRNSAAGIPETDLRSYLEPSELSRYNASMRSDTSLTSAAENSESAELLHIARLRRHACKKYNGGARIWSGDGPPPWR